ncbi:MAG: hypothetical protein HOH56_08600, partial [Acidiferrobacteraceae bacterium]|nr:hypothetical protein [Acidiferrobacteraceae bacterium]
MMDQFARRYDAWVLGRPLLVLLALALVLGFFVWQARDFRLDASADSLLLEDDHDLQVFRDLSDRYRSRSFLVVALTPHDGVFTPATLKRIARLAEDLGAVGGIESVVSLLDAPLLAQGESSLMQLSGEYRTLRDTGVDLAKAREELTASPVFSELVISVDGAATALQLNLEDTPGFRELQDEKRALAARVRDGIASPAERARLDQVRLQYRALKTSVDQSNHDTIVHLRQVMEGYDDLGQLYLG